MTAKLATVYRPDETIPDTPHDLPDHIDLADVPAAIAHLEPRGQLILMMLACYWTRQQIADALAVGVDAINMYVSRHDLCKLVSSVSPQAKQKFEAARWSQLQHACLTRAQAGIGEMSPSQAVVAAAIAVDKRSAIDPPAQREGDAPGELEAQLTIRFKRKA